MIEIIKKEIIDSDNPIHRKILKDRYNKKLAVSMALRCRRFDRYVQDFLSDNPEGTIINLGCGLDTRFDRIDNGKMRWFDIESGKPWSIFQLKHNFSMEVIVKQIEHSTKLKLKKDLKLNALA